MALALEVFMQFEAPDYGSALLFSHRLCPFG